MTDQSLPPRVPRGGAPLGHLTDLDPVSSAAVMYLRLWCEGAQRAIAGDFSLALGEGAGTDGYTAFTDLCHMCHQHGRRPLMRHQVNCSCFGGDEACFAQLVAAASEGAREDALMMAMLIVRPDLAPLVVAQATQAGLALRRMMQRRRDGRVLH